MGIEPPSPHRQVDKSTSRQVDNVDNDRQGTHVVTINLESTTSTMVDKELTTHRQFTVDNWSTMVDKVDKLSTRSTRSTNRAQPCAAVAASTPAPSLRGLLRHHEEGLQHSRLNLRAHAEQ